jgi:hypothetical protein
MNQQSVVAGLVLQSWRQVLERANKTVASFNDDELQREVAPGKNRVYYLVGHLTATHDRLFALLRVGEACHPELDAQFFTTPDRKFTGAEVAPADVRKAWLEVNAKLTAALDKLQPEEWLERHGAVSEEDFAKEPHRNRLTVLISRMNHVAYHEGQIKLAR